MPRNLTPTSPTHADSFCALPDWRPAQRESPELFAAVAAVLFQHDPIGINFGLNTDEYEPEAGTILPRLRDCQDAAAVGRMVHEEFRRWFGPAAPSAAAEYAPIARAIWALLAIPASTPPRHNEAVAVAALL